MSEHSILAVGVLPVLILALAIMPPNARARGFGAGMDEEGDVPMPEKSITLTVVYNNLPCDKRLTTAWGMACLVERSGRTVLFDTGGNGRILLENMKILAKHPEDVDVVVLSHIHADHTGGLAAFLRQNSNVEVFLPQSFPVSFKRQVNVAGAKVVEVQGPQQIAEGIHTTGQMGSLLKEQALVLDTPQGLVVVTGCSHPGVANLAARAVEVCPNREFHLVTGGFHLGGHSQGAIKKIIKAFRELGIQKVGPSHCTGDRAIQLFREAWRDDFLDLGCGAQITISQR